MVICVEEIHDDPDMSSVYFADINNSLSVYTNLVTQAARNTNKTLFLSVNAWEVGIAGLRYANLPCQVDDKVILRVG